MAKSALESAPSTDPVSVEARLESYECARVGSLGLLAERSLESSFQEARFVDTLSERLQ